MRCINHPGHPRTSGFTLIELVIVILGILATVAIPRLINPAEEAEIAVCEGADGALMSTAPILLTDSDVGGTGKAGTRQQILDNTVANGWQGQIDRTALRVPIATIAEESSFSTPDLVDLGLAQAS